MVINNVPCLACDTKIAALKGDVITIEPLRKFPVVEDLVVDRDSMMETLKKLSVWFEDGATERNEEYAFEASKCFQCGLCLEVCPNFRIDRDFGGMAAMNPLLRLISKAPDIQKEALRKNYKRGVYNGCGKSLSCRNICPANIDMEKLLVKGNAAALWNKF